ncbi:MAG TPA: HAD family hydrolase [Anaerolineae bacterium]|nr:HAD family hydrolase [Anaerolineae bacterium]
MIGAFFDLDGTLCTEHIWRALTQYPYPQRWRRLVVRFYLISHVLLWPLHRTGLLSKETFYRLWGQDMAWILAGLSPSEAEEVFHWIADQHILPSLRPDAMEILRHHQGEGHFVALVSGTFEELLTIIGRRMGVDHVVGTRLEVRRGRYTGRLASSFCFGTEKAERLRGFLRENELGIDLAASFAYGDSAFDLPFLEMVGHPVAVHPDDELRATAVQRGWPVIGEPSAGKSS